MITANRCSNHIKHLTSLRTEHSVSIVSKTIFRAYFKIVLIFFVVSVVNNQALNFHVPVPLHIIFRSVNILFTVLVFVNKRPKMTFKGSLLASMMMGIIVLNRRYTMKKYLSVCLITIGVITCTLADSRIEKVW